MYPAGRSPDNALKKRLGWRQNSVTLYRRDKFPSLNVFTIPTKLSRLFVVSEFMPQYFTLTASSVADWRPCHFIDALPVCNRLINKAYLIWNKICVIFVVSKTIIIVTVGILLIKDRKYQCRCFSEIQHPLSGGSIITPLLWDRLSSGASYCVSVR
jgi:hypothetical protein